MKTVDLFIIDTPSQNYGGTGNTYDWNVLIFENHVFNSWRVRYKSY